MSVEFDFLSEQGKQHSLLEWLIVFVTFMSGLLQEQILHWANVWANVFYSLSLTLETEILSIPR